MNTHPSAPISPSSRREFLQQAAGLAAGVASLTAPATAAPAVTTSQLPTIKLGEHAVTRLIIGGNPMYGYSHFNKLQSNHPFRRMPGGLVLAKQLGEVRGAVNMIEADDQAGKGMRARIDCWQAGRGES